MDELDTEAVVMDDREYNETRVAKAIHYAGLPLGMRLLLYAYRNGMVRIRDVLDDDVFTIMNARTYMWRMQRIGLFEKRQVSQQNVYYVLTDDGQAVAECLEKLFHSGERSDVE